METSSCVLVPPTLAKEGRHNKSQKRAKLRLYRLRKWLQRRPISVQAPVMLVKASGWDKTVSRRT